jgi:hypothetical protein
LEKLRERANHHLENGLNQDEHAQQATPVDSVAAAAELFVVSWKKLVPDPKRETAQHAAVLPIGDMLEDGEPLPVPSSRGGISPDPTA